MNVSIYNHIGQVVYHSDNVKATGSGEVRIDISDLNTGSYTFRAVSEDLVFE
jgi:hypothetical protein